MQISGGYIEVEQGNATVLGGGNINWSNVEVNNWLIVNGVIYFIADVTDAATGVLVLSEAYKGTTNANVTDYVIVRDFTSFRSLPLINPGDQEVAALISRAMQMIDPLLGGTAAGEEVSLAQNSHGFVVGNCLYLNGTTWTKANASDSATANVICVVSAVTDTNNFKVKTNGIITGISGITLTPKSIYYLRTSTTGYNITNVAPTAPNVVLPMMVALTTNSAFLLSLGIARPSVFNNTNNGLVPAPNGATGFLKQDGTWTATGIVDGSVQARHVDNTNTTVNFNTLTDPASSQSLIRHILDLNTRLAAVESQTNGGIYTRNVFTRNLNTTGASDITDMASPKKATITVGGSGPLDIPVSAGYIIISAISGSTVEAIKPTNSGAYRLWNSMPPYKVKYALAVYPAEQIHLYIGVQRRSAVHTQNPNGATNIIIYKGTTKIIDLVGNMRTGKRAESKNQLNFVLWQGNYRHPSMITQYAEHPTTPTLLPTAYNNVENGDWFSEITVAHVPTDSVSNSKSQDFWAGMVVIEWGFGASPFVS